MALFKTLKVTVGTAPNTVTYYFRGEDGVYIGDIATETGVNEAPDSETNRARTSVPELLQKGVLVRVIATTGVAGGDNNKQVKLLVRRDKIGTAIDTLPAASIKGADIVSVRIPTKATFF